MPDFVSLQLISITQINVLLSEFQNLPPREINQILNYIATNVRFVPNLETILSYLKTIGRTFHNQHIQMFAVDWIAPTNVFQINGPLRSKLFYSDDHLI